MLYHLMLPRFFFFGGGGGGLNVGPRFFFFGGGAVVLNPRDFLRFPFLPPFDHPCHLKSGVLPHVMQHAVFFFFFFYSSLECN